MMTEGIKELMRVMPVFVFGMIKGKEGVSGLTLMKMLVTVLIYSSILIPFFIAMKFRNWSDCR